MAPLEVKNKVFVTNYADHDYSSAEKYGELVFITKGYVSFKSLDRLRLIVYETIKESNENDWLLISGHGVVSLICGIVWFAKHKKCKLLIWDTKKQDKYRPTVIDQSRLDKMFEVLSD